MTTETLTIASAIINVVAYFCLGAVYVMVRHLWFDTAVAKAPSLVRVVLVAIWPVDLAVSVIGLFAWLFYMVFSGRAS